MAKLKRKQPREWTLLHEIHTHKNGNQAFRTDIVLLAQFNHNGKVIRSKPIPEGEISTVISEEEEGLSLSDEILATVDRIVTRRVFNENEAYDDPIVTSITDTNALIVDHVLQFGT